LSYLRIYKNRRNILNTINFYCDGIRTRNGESRIYPRNVPMCITPVYVFTNLPVSLFSQPVGIPIPPRLFLLWRARRVLPPLPPHRQCGESAVLLHAHKICLDISKPLNGGTSFNTYKTFDDFFKTYVNGLFTH